MCPIDCLIQAIELVLGIFFGVNIAKVKLHLFSFSVSCLDYPVVHVKMSIHHYNQHTWHRYFT